MEAFTYRGRTVTESDVAFIKRLITEHPDSSRWALSQKLCKAWNWVQPNGQLRDMVCRSFMLKLHRADLIELPPARRGIVNNVIRRHSKQRQGFLIDTSPLTGRLSEIGHIEFRQVRRSGYEEHLFEWLIAEQHYLGYARPVGEHLKYLVYADKRPIACFGWSSATRRLGHRDRFIGWSAEARRDNIRYLAYNTRFLILPWVSVKHLASHLLGQMARRISSDWESIYGHSIYYLESFVDADRFSGTSYRAANWEFLGLSSGRGTRAKTHAATVPKKEVLGLPLSRRFRELLSSTSRRREGR